MGNGEHKGIWAKKPENMHNRSMTSDVHKYIDTRIEDEHKPQTIKEQLVSYGYDEKEIEDKLDIEQKKVTRESASKEDKDLGKLQNFLLICVGIVFVFFIIWLIMTVQSPPFNVLIGFMPTLICFIVGLIVIENVKEIYNFVLWPLPIVTSLLFYLIGESGVVPVLRNVDVGSLAFFNLLASFSFILAIEIIGMTKISRAPRDRMMKSTMKIEEKKKEKRIDEKLKALEMKEEELDKLREHVQSIEDKSKALNFVIGRVYCGKHGGNKLIRSRIQVEKDLYNEFSKLNVNNPQDKAKAWNILNRIKSKLEHLEMREIDVFREECYKFVNIKRMSNGSETVIKILARNDKDPVETYLKGAKNFCIEALKALQK